MEALVIRLKPVNVEEWLVAELQNHLKSSFNAKITVERDVSIGSLQAYYDEEREQIRADLLLEDLSKYAQPISLVIIDADAYVPGLNFIFGIARPEWGGIVFLARLKPEYYYMPPDEELLLYRFIKESIHELGHALGLNHCRNTACVMRFSNSIHEVDAKTHRFCIQCSRRLQTLHPGLLR